MRPLNLRHAARRIPLLLGRFHAITKHSDSCLARSSRQSLHSSSSRESTQSSTVCGKCCVAKRLWGDGVLSRLKDVKSWTVVYRAQEHEGHSVCMRKSSSSGSCQRLAHLNRLVSTIYHANRFRWALLWSSWRRDRDEPVTSRTGGSAIQVRDASSSNVTPAPEVTDEPGESRWDHASRPAQACTCTA